MRLEYVLEKVRNEHVYKSFVATTQEDPSKVLGGCVIKEHFTFSSNLPFAELSLLAVDQENHCKGLGRHLLEKLKGQYECVATFADLRAIGFFEKLGFKAVEE